MYLSFKVQVLLDYGCKLDVEDARGRNGLHLAACCEDPLISDALARKLPRLVKHADTQGRTPLFYAVLNMYPTSRTIVKTLLDLQAEIDIMDIFDRRAVDYAVEEDRRAAVELLQHQSFVLSGKSRASCSHSPAALVKHNQHNPNMGMPRVPSESSPWVADACRPATTGSMRRQTKHGHEDGAHPVYTKSPGRTPRSVSPIPNAPPPGDSSQRVHWAAHAPFRALQQRFVQLMTEVQDRGIEHMEHVKKPHLFTGSWMAKVYSHQQLLGDVLDAVPGPEVCIRVFNLLHPPQSLPVPLGDERAIRAHYNHTAQVQEAAGSWSRNAWGGQDSSHDLSLAQGQSFEQADLIASVEQVRLQRRFNAKDLEVREQEQVIAALQQKVAEQRTELHGHGQPGERQQLQEELQDAKRLLSENGDHLAKTREQAMVLTGERQVLAKQLSLEKERSVTLMAEQCEARSQLDVELLRRGEHEVCKAALGREQNQ
eukprot:5440573-Amphidinium_carterae.1